MMLSHWDGQKHQAKSLARDMVALTTSFLRPHLCLRSKIRQNTGPHLYKGDNNRYPPRVSSLP